MSASRAPAGARLHLVRHGATVLAGTGLLAGARLDPPLSAEGERQAAEVAARLRAHRVARVVASPLRRAVDTARAIASPHGLAVETDPDLAELDFGLAEGLAFEEVERRFPEVARAWAERPAEVRFPEGECFAELAARVDRALGRLFPGAAGGDLVVVTHAGPIRAVLARVGRLAPDAALRLACPYGTSVAVDLDPAARRTSNE